MEVVYFTVAGIALYLVSDWLLDRFEHWLGRRHRYRSLIFFAIMAVLTLALFAVIQNYSPA